MLITLFTLIYRFIASPDGMWKDLAPDRDAGNEKFHNDYFHILIGVIALVAFAGVFLSGGSFGVALKAVIREAVTLFGSLYLAAYGIRFLANRKFGVSLSRRICEKYVGYSSAAVYVSAIASALFPAFPWFHLFALYSFVIARSGAEYYLGLKSPFEGFAFTATTVIVLSPWALRGLLYVAI
ncbi:MAG: hypothetical protein LBS54_05195 [Dysgonamonadaceae bacterium]|jgi:hypothetical protein|nr:hypothetical protein [Dysgonamonadaceae bacterium]